MMRYLTKGAHMRSYSPIQNRSQERTHASLARLGSARGSPAIGEHPLSSLQRVVGNQAVQRMFHPPPELEVGRPGDEYEQAADRIAAQVLTASVSPADHGAAAPKGMERHAPESVPSPGPLPDVLQRGLRSDGQTLDAGTRQFMETWFGRRFDHVRVHSDASADQSARALGAQAYTAGSHIVFAGGRYSPASPQGRQLIAHELAHVVQQLSVQSAAQGNACRVQRQPAASARAPGSTWKELWHDFQFSRISRSPESTTSLAKEMMAAPREPGDLLKQGVEVVDWLQSHGEFESAARLLEDVRAEFTIAWSTDQELPQQSAFFGVFAPGGDLIELGKQAARNGRHDDAFRFFGVAHEILSFYAHQRTAQRQAGDSARWEAYLGLRNVYDSMREIYGFYNALEQEALTSGDPKAAAQARAKGAELLQVIKEEYSPSNEPVETIEATTAGSALEMEGINDVKTQLTALPGLTAPSEIGEGARVEQLGSVQSALAAQADLQAEMGREPAIRQAFGSTPLDFNDTKQRQLAWQIMYTSYKQAGPGALGKLMALIGRYLKAYTVHTSYNIRDFGPNYLDSQFPVDIAGRAEKDCGVYALSVAWDVFQTMKHADSKLEVNFRLATSLDHVTLIIDDTSTGETYLVNNDTVTRINEDTTPVTTSPRPFYRTSPFPGGWTGTYDDQPVWPSPWVVPEEQVEKEYAMLRGLPYLATPFFYRSLGSTKDPVSTFHGGIWANYLAATGEIASKEDALNAALKEEHHGNVHSLQKVFAEKAMTLDVLMDQLTPFRDSGEELSSHLAADMPDAIATLVLFERFVKAFTPFNAAHRFSYSWQRGAVHPLVRTALAILRLQKLHGPITEDQQKFLEYCEKVFKELAEHREAGEAGTF